MHLGVVDFINSVTGVGSFEEVKKQSVEIPLLGHKCKVISLDALISAKEKMGRIKDKLVLIDLKKIKNSK